MKFPWIKHPRSGQEDTMLTFSTLAVASALAKFLLNGTAIEIAGKTFSAGTVDAALIGAILVPTLGAYVARKAKDSPDTKKTITTRKK